MTFDLLRITWFVVLTAGGTSLARLSDSFSELGVFGELRFIGLVAIASIFLLAAPAQRRMATGGERWLAGVIALHGWAALSYVWSWRGEFARTQLTEIALLVTSLALTAGLCRDCPARAFRQVLWVFYTLACLLVAFSLGTSGGLQGQVAAIGAGGIGTARVLTMGALAALVLADETRRRALLVPVPLMIAGAFLTGSRAALLAFVVAILVGWSCRAWGLAAAGRVWTPVKEMTAGLAVLAFLGLLPSFYPLVQMGVDLLLVPSRAGASSFYLADRDVIFAHAAELTVSNPLTGLGLGEYMGPFGEIYPHNFVLGFGVDGGAFAALASIALVAYASRRVSRLTSDVAAPLLACAAFFATAGFFAGTYYDNRYLWIVLLIGMLRGEQRPPLNAWWGVLVATGEHQRRIPRERTQ